MGSETVRLPTFFNSVNWGRRSILYSGCFMCLCLGLRQEYASTAATATHRSASFSVHTGARKSMRSEAELEEEEEYDQLSAPQPRLFRTSSMQRSTSHSQSLSSMRECRRSPSTPQYLNSLSFQQLHMPNHSSSTATEPQSYRANAGQTTHALIKHRLKIYW